MISTLTAAPIVIAMATGICSPPPDPIIEVRPVADELIIDNERSIDELAKIEISTVSPYDHMSTEVHGLMQGPIDLVSDISVSWETNTQNSDTCLWYGKISLQLRLSPVMFIAKRAEPGTCRYRAVYNHEIKHVNVDREIVNKYAIELEQHVRKFIDRYPVFGPFKEYEVERVQADMMERLRYSFEGVLARMEAERAEKQMAVDSLEEYQNVAAECRGIDDGARALRQDTRHRKKNKKEDEEDSSDLRHFY